MQVVEDEGTKTEHGYLVKVPVRWSDMDVYQHINHARMVTLLEERASVVVLRRPAHGDAALGLCGRRPAREVPDAAPARRGPLEVTMFTQQVRAVDFTVGYEVRPKGGAPDSKPAIVASTQLVAFDVDTQRLRRLTPEEKAYLLEFAR